MADPQVHAAGGFVDVPDGDTTTKLPATPVDFGGTPWAPRSMAPAHGQHTDEILAELGRSAAQIADLRASGVTRLMAKMKTTARVYEEFVASGYRRHRPVLGQGRRQRGDQMGHGEPLVARGHGLQPRLIRLRDALGIDDAQLDRGPRYPRIGFKSSSAGESSHRRSARCFALPPYTDNVAGGVTPMRRRMLREGAPALHTLRDLRVIDLSTGIAGGYATKLLCDAGADVVKVEPPGGDPLRHFTASGRRSRGSRRAAVPVPRGRQALGGRECPARRTSRRSWPTRTSWWSRSSSTCSRPRAMSKNTPGWWCSRSPRSGARARTWDDPPPSSRCRPSADRSPRAGSRRSRRSWPAGAPPNGSAARSRRWPRSRPCGARARTGSASTSTSRCSR